jgi:hypothetical protein
MTSAIGGSTPVSFTSPAPAVTPQVKTGKDSDGDYDASKVGEVEASEPSSENPGTVINTKA